MGAGRQRSDEWYIGFLFLLLAFLYLSMAFPDVKASSQETVQIATMEVLEVENG